MIEKKTLRSLALNYIKLNKNNKGIDIIGNKEYISVESLIKVFEDDSITSFEDLRDFVLSELKEKELKDD